MVTVGTANRTRALVHSWPRQRPTSHGAISGAAKHHTEAATRPGRMVFDCLRRPPRERWRGPGFTATILDSNPAQLPDPVQNELRGSASGGAGRPAQSG